MSEGKGGEAQEQTPEEIYQSLLRRTGEAAPQPRLEATRRAVELLGDPQRSYPIVHVTGTNGKSSTSRIIESLLRAHGLRTGLFISPHLVDFTERIVIDGEPISAQSLVQNWHDIHPVLSLVDAEFESAAKPPLTYFEALTVLAYACFAEAPVDVAVIEVGMGGDWDSTNVGDGEVAVFTPISLDHTARLGNTVEEIARTKSGIIKPLARVVSAVQQPEALAELQRAAEMSEATLAVQQRDFFVHETKLAVGGQLITVQGAAGRYQDVFLPLYGEHQAQNAAVAIAAVEALIGGGQQPISADIVAEGLGSARSPGRLQVIGHNPTVVVDAAHNPAGAEALARAVEQSFDFSECAVVLGIVADKDVPGIVQELNGIAARFYVSQSHSDRSIEHDELSQRLRQTLPNATVIEEDSLDQAMGDAREWAAAALRRAVLVTGSILLIGETVMLAEEEGWRVA